MSISRTALLVAAIGCLTSCDSNAPPPPNLGAYVLTGGLNTTPSASTESVGVQNCFVAGPDSRSWRLESGGLTFDEGGAFELTYVAQLYPYDVTTPDTFRVAGAYERHGPILHLRPTGAHAPNWFATAGPDPSDPTTIVLGDYGPDHEVILRNGGCGHLVFTAPGAQADRAVRGGPRPASFDLYGLVPESGSSVLLLPIMRFGRMANNSYYGGDLEFLSGGAYRFSFDHTIGNDYVADDTLRTVSVATGPYVASGPLYALDPGTGRMAFAVQEGDSLYLYRNYVSSAYWSITLETSADLLFRQE